MSSKIHLERVHQIPCVVCELMGLKQESETAAHHVESVRDEDSDYGACALCYDHHQGANGVHGLGRRGFVTRYKLTDIDLIALTIKGFYKHGILS